MPNSKSNPITQERIDGVITRLHPMHGLSGHDAAVTLIEDLATQRDVVAVVEDIRKLISGRLTYTEQAIRECTSAAMFSNLIPISKDCMLYKILKDIEDKYPTK